ncbi:hypothetical protein XA68_12998 [Ophiocordyceps unilateralis]|uniref:Myb-like domain-containing protein n=1 Tax=Ophiocordyceps unilateralis TaxID=268505 RepID=A0A2A9PMJ0_OPHUN|nr:hypothetical protein XA68_12998 [Ophiocordyceps unilateralis]
MKDSDSDSYVDEQSRSHASSDLEVQTAAENSESRPSSSHGTGTKRRPCPHAAPSPLAKRRRKSTFNSDYLDLLNRDIEEAVQRVCLDQDPDLPFGQVGLIFWSPVEKQQFFEAVARLGRHDLPGIASRVGTKSLVEIRQYLRFLQEADAIRRQPAADSFLEFAEYPAAVELSQQCCHAQEEAADAISLRQGRREAQREADKWGHYWDVTPEVAAELDIADHHTPPFAQLFHVRCWLTLSEQILMNSSVPGDNWRFVGHDPPSIWATTLQDFHSLAVSLTRRLVQTTLFITMSRIRAKERVDPGIRGIVRTKDVEAAIHSLALTPNASRFWLKSARRLRLCVYRELPLPKDSAEEPMSYDEVEAELAVAEDSEDASEPVGTQATIQIDKVSDAEDEEEPSDDDDSKQSSDDSADDESSTQDQEQAEISREAKEVLWHSAVDLRDVRSKRRPLERRIAMERRQEEQAERWDEYASYQAELEMWTLLRETPPPDMPKAHEPGRLER